MLSMLALAVGPLLAIVIAPPSGPDEACPSARQVTAALQAHVGGMIVNPDPKGAALPRADLLRAVLDVPGDGTVVRFSLVDGFGEVQLHRALPAPGRGGPAADCVALAETIATIVERYLSSVPYRTKETEPPPPPPPPPAPPAPPATPGPEPVRGEVPPGAGALDARRTWITAGLGWRAATQGKSLFELRVGGALEVTRGARPWAASLHAAADQGQVADVQAGPGYGAGSISFRRFTGRLGLGIALPAGPGVLEPALGAGVDVFVKETSTTSPASSTRSIRTVPAAEAQVGYRIALSRHFFVRPAAAFGLAMFSYKVGYGKEAAGPSAPIFFTPAWFSTLALDVGVVFR